jgi:hypothetical protein
VRGLQVTIDGRAVRFAPSQMVADNLSFERALGRAAQQLAVSPQRLLHEAQLHTFEAYQVVLSARGGGGATQLFRGKPLVAAEAVDLTSVRTLEAGMAQWMWRNLHPDGRMTYMYYPSSGRESSNNNMIRQWMASLSLTRLALAGGDPQLLARAEQNIRYNLEQFFRQEGDLGLIEYRGKVKLGAIALAALTLLEHPAGDTVFAAQRAALIAATDHLWQEDGSFRNFYRPESRNQEANLHNFYPGETLLLWSGLLARELDQQRLQRFMTSYEYYRQWHLEQRKPAFVPWHTQAYYQLWQQTGDTRLRDWIFIMNDWLLGMQANSRLAYDDTIGRFYDPAPERAHFGPPHASSTGVYLEGLIDAYALARHTGDGERAERYARAIRLGLRSAMQLQFSPGPQNWFVADPERVVGGLRTTVYNNVIRVDNVQHTLMGVHKILAVARADGVGLLTAAPRE